MDWTIVSHILLDLAVIGLSLVMAHHIWRHPK